MNCLNVKSECLCWQCLIPLLTSRAGGNRAEKHAKTEELRGGIKLMDVLSQSKLEFCDYFISNTKFSEAHDWLMTHRVLCLRSLSRTDRLPSRGAKRPCRHSPAAVTMLRPSEGATVPLSSCWGCLIRRQELCWSTFASGWVGFGWVVSHACNRPKIEQQHHFPQLSCLVASWRG